MMNNNDIFKHNINDETNDETIDEIILKKIYNKSNSFLNIKYLKDTSYELFDTIFNDIELKNIKTEKVVIEDYEDFRNFQIDLNSDYLEKIKKFEYIMIKIIFL